MKTMKALTLINAREMEIKNVSIPTIQKDEILIKVSYCGICGTDVHIFHGEPGSAEVTPPIVLGHEFSGIIVEIGSNVKNFSVGDHVAIDPNIYCGFCQYCAQGRVQLCDNLSALGVTRNGGMAEFCAVPETSCFKLLKDLPLELGAMVEPLSCVLHGFDQIDDINSETTVLIIGGGFIGSLFLQTVLLKSPKKVTVCELDKNKHSLLKDLGAQEIYTSTNDILENFDIIIECVGKKSTSEATVDLANKGGNILLFGVPSPETDITLCAFSIFSKELKIASSFINPYTPLVATKLINEKELNISSLISHTIELEDVPDILKNYSKRGITKAIIRL